VSSKLIQTSNDNMTCDDDDGDAPSRSKESNHPTDQQIHTSSIDFDSIPTASLHGPDDHQQRSPPANNFKEVLRCIFEAPSTSLHTAILNKDDFFSTESTFLHYIAAKGRMGEVLREVLLFCKSNGFSVDSPDQYGSTSLHVAIRNDRTDNAVALIDAGASLIVADPPFGELPLHMAIRCCSDSRVVEVINNRCEGVAKMPVQYPSEHQGQVALDLVVNRLLHEIPVVGRAVCTRTTAKMFSEIIKTTPTIEDTVHLQRHAYNKWKLFLQAEIAVGHLSFGHALRDTMRRVEHQRLFEHQQEQAQQGRQTLDDWFEYVGLEVKTIW
jgi:hypothetical protein